MFCSVKKCGKTKMMLGVEIPWDPDLIRKAQWKNRVQLGRWMRPVVCDGCWARIGGGRQATTNPPSYGDAMDDPDEAYWVRPDQCPRGLQQMETSGDPNMLVQYVTSLRKAHFRGPEPKQRKPRRLSSSLLARFEDDGVRRMSGDFGDPAFMQQSSSAEAAVGNYANLRRLPSSVAPAVGDYANLRRLPSSVAPAVGDYANLQRLPSSVAPAGDARQGALPPSHPPLLRQHGRRRLRSLSSEGVIRPPLTHELRRRRPAGQ